MVNVDEVPLDEPLRVIVGAGDQAYPGWISTGKKQLDLIRSEDWSESFGSRLVDTFLAEHVWEHLTEAEGRRAASLCYRYLKPGGVLRCAVPDANFPDEAYQRSVQVGGPGPVDHPAVDRKIVYDYRRFRDVFVSAGFEVDLLEYCDGEGRFHHCRWDPSDGPIYRSLLSDHWNKEGRLGFVSIVLDARKPLA